MDMPVPDEHRQRRAFRECSMHQCPALLCWINNVSTFQ
ncbi:hypothetical protein PXO_05767 [Xanthomonas oryzae pv. oryzae PXO99A]|uniref:Uncharacterized protein n=1 Tax=Xanthomonas oryzae pv. oryzae (strain PXO99A) TaxID=360094 RepID=A0A0K0GQ34_XANOP|nr:hypothetical protein PXO_05767 [Xanthomonas oryzae pv. oryzae PXO99A]